MLLSAHLPKRARGPGGRGSWRCFPGCVEEALIKRCMDNNGREGYSLEKISGFQDLGEDHQQTVREVRLPMPRSRRSRGLAPVAGWGDCGCLDAGCTALPAQIFEDVQNERDRRKAEKAQRKLDRKLGKKGGGGARAAPRKEKASKQSASGFETVRTRSRQNCSTRAPTRPQRVRSRACARVCALCESALRAPLAVPHLRRLVQEGLGCYA